MRTILTLLACLMLAPLTSGCSVAGEYCDVKCQCEDCSDREYDECLIDYEATEDVADAYGCLEDFDRLHVCVIENNDCTLDNFIADVRCSDEGIDLADCINDSSSL